MHVIARLKFVAQYSIKDTQISALAALSIQILDVSGTSESDTSAAKEMDIHKVRLDSKGGFAKEWHMNEHQALQSGLKTTA